MLQNVGSSASLALRVSMKTTTPAPRNGRARITASAREHDTTFLPTRGPLGAAVKRIHTSAFQQIRPRALQTRCISEDPSTKRRPIRLPNLRRLDAQCLLIGAHGTLHLQIPYTDSLPSPVCSQSRLLHLHPSTTSVQYPPIGNKLQPCGNKPRIPVLPQTELGVSNYVPPHAHLSQAPQRQRAR